MKCPSCSNWIEIQTDPKNAEYQVTEGGRKKMENYTNESAGIGGTRLTPEEGEKLASNPFFKLEHESRDLRRAQEELPRLKSLQKANESLFKDDWESSRKARQAFRERKQKNEEEVKIIESFKKRSGGLDIKLVQEHPDDLEKAREIDFSNSTRQFEAKKKKLQSQNRLESLKSDPNAEKVKKFIKPKQ